MFATLTTNFIEAHNALMQVQELWWHRLYDVLYEEAMLTFQKALDALFDEIGEHDFNTHVLELILRGVI